MFSPVFVFYAALSLRQQAFFVLEKNSETDYIISCSVSAEYALLNAEFLTLQGSFYVFVFSAG